MFKKRYYVILGILVVTMVSVLAVVISKTRTKAIPAQVKKEVLKNQIEMIREHMKKRETDLAITLANRYLKSEPNNTEVLIRLAECYARKGDLVSAEETVKKALDINKEEPWAIRVLANIYRRQSEIQKEDSLKKKYLDLAQTEIEKDLLINPDDPRINAEAAHIYFYQNNKAKAIQAIEAALKVEPKDDYFQYLQNVEVKIQSMP